MNSVASKLLENLERLWSNWIETLFYLNWNIQDTCIYYKQMFIDLHFSEQQLPFNDEITLNILQDAFIPNCII